MLLSEASKTNIHSAPYLLASLAVVKELITSSLL